MLGRDLNSRGMGTCRGSIPPLRRILIPNRTIFSKRNFYQYVFLVARLEYIYIYIYIYVIQFLNNSLLQCKSNIKKNLIVEIACASIAQLLEHALRKHMAAGSIPTGRFVCFLFFFRFT